MYRVYSHQCDHSLVKNQLYTRKNLKFYQFLFSDPVIIIDYKGIFSINAEMQLFSSRDFNVITAHLSYNISWCRVSYLVTFSKQKLVIHFKLNKQASCLYYQIMSEYINARVKRGKVYTPFCNYHDKPQLYKNYGIMVYTLQHKSYSYCKKLDKSLTTSLCVAHK